MTAIDTVTGRTMIGPAASGARRTASGFHVPEDGLAESPGTAAASLVGHVSLDVMLAAEALEQDARRNATARRHGQAMLRGLGTLQHTLLSGSDPHAALATLAQLVGDLPPVSDPGLAALLDSIALRARVELARRGG